MEEAVAKLLEQNAHINNKLEMLCGLLPKVEEISSKIQSLSTENAALRQDIAARDAKIDQLTSHVNKLDQASRATSLRILGLPITSATPSSAVPEIAYKEVIVPCIEAAIANGDISAQLSAFPLHLIVSNAFALPAKKDQPSCPVILKLSSELIRNIIFRHKKDALSKFTDRPPIVYVTASPSSKICPPPTMPPSAPSPMTPGLRVRGPTADRSVSRPTMVTLYTKSKTPPIPLTVLSSDLPIPPIPPPLAPSHPPSPPPSSPPGFPPGNVPGLRAWVTCLGYVSGLATTTESGLCFW